MPNPRNFLDDLFILLPDNKKFNNKLFQKQKGPLCSVYSLLRMLHFHQYHPHNTENNYSKNFMQALETFKKVRKTSIHFLNEVNPELDYDTICEQLEQELVAIEESDWDSIDIPEFDEDEESFDYGEYSSRNEYYGFLFGFQALTKPYMMNNFNQELIKEYLTKCGPLLVGGQIAIDGEPRTPIGELQNIKNSVSYSVKNVTLRPKVTHDEHAVTVIGIKLSDDSPMLYYIDPMYPQEIIEVNFNEFKKNLLVANYYFPCEKENNYLKNSIRNCEEEVIQSSCKHTLNAIDKMRDLSFTPAENSLSEEKKTPQKRKLMMFSPPSQEEEKKARQEDKETDADVNIITMP